MLVCPTQIKKQREGKERDGTRTVQGEETFHKVETNLIQTTVERFVFSSNLVKMLFVTISHRIKHFLSWSQPGFLPNHRTRGHVYSLETLVLTHVEVCKMILSAQQKATNRCRAA